MEAAALPTPATRQRVPMPTEAAPLIPKGKAPPLQINTALLLLTLKVRAPPTLQMPTAVPPRTLRAKERAPLTATAVRRITLKVQAPLPRPMATAAAPLTTLVLALWGQLPPAKLSLPATTIMVAHTVPPIIRQL